jgi:hypothetical protein
VTEVKVVTGSQILGELLARFARYSGSRRQPPLLALADGV